MMMRLPMMATATVPMVRRIRSTRVIDRRVAKAVDIAMMTMIELAMII